MGSPASAAYLSTRVTWAHAPRQTDVPQSRFPAAATFGRFVWMVFSDDVRRVARSNRKQWSGTLSTHPESKDEWVPFGYELKDIASVVSALLDRVEKDGEPLRTAVEVNALLKRIRRRVKKSG